MIELDEDTLKEAAKKNSAAFEKVYRHYSPYIWKVVFRMANRDTHDAEHIMQDIFLKAYLRLHTFRFESAFSTWLYRIAYTTTLNTIRSSNGRVRKTVQFTERNSPPVPPQQIENKEIVDRILGSLDPEDRFLLVAREIEAVPFEELEKVTGKTSGSLRTQVSRLKESIRKEFGYER